MIISIINHAQKVIDDEEVLEIVRAINYQIKYDFEPYWSLGATIRLEGGSIDLPDDEDFKKVFPVDMRGDAILYLWDKVDPDAALGFHEKHFNGIPFGVVYTEICDRLKENYSVAMSHEALELIGDENANIFAMGPHPDPDTSHKKVFHWYEMCDAVQSEHYVIHGIEVSNFVLPLYFTDTDEKGSRNDFLGRKNNGKTLNSFGVKEGGYIGFYDPELFRTIKWLLPNDQEAKRRMEIKKDAEGTRRALRYQRVDANPPQLRFAKQDNVN
jgi:hypothetical protein